MAAFRGRKRFTACPPGKVKSKKKETLGNFKNAGTAYSTQAWAANDHDFKRGSTGIAIPRGNYDPAANRGHVCAWDRLTIRPHSRLIPWRAGGGMRAVAILARANCPFLPSPAQGDS